MEYQLREDTEKVVIVSREQHSLVALEGAILTARVERHTPDCSYMYAYDKVRGPVLRECSGVH